MFPFKKKARTSSRADAAKISDLAMRAASLHSMGQHERALSCIDEAFSLGPEMPRFFFLHLTRSAILLELRRYEEVIRECDQGLAIGAPEAGFLKNKGLALKRLGKLADALSCYERAARLEPRDPALWLDLGSLLMELQRPFDALQSYQRGLDIEPGHVLLMADMGNALYMLKRTQEAIEWYNRALSVNPRDAIVWHNLGVALRDLGNYQTCLQCFDRALEIAPRDARTWKTKAEVLLTSGREDEANACFNRAEELRPH